MSFLHHGMIKLHGILLDHPADGDQRCIDCGGACCRSFTDVQLSWEEYLRLRDLGASRLQFSLAGPHRLIIDYNCEFLDRGRCTIYEDRPDVCRRFFCESDTG